jgi:hypothetical protein
MSSVESTVNYSTHSGSKAASRTTSARSPRCSVSRNSGSKRYGHSFMNVSRNATTGDLSRNASNACGGNVMNSFDISDRPVGWGRESGGIRVAIATLQPVAMDPPMAIHSSAVCSLRSAVSDLRSERSCFQPRSSYAEDLVPRAARENFRAGETRTRLLAKVLRDILATETFESLSDLTDALKYRCGRLHIQWTNEAISGAFRVVGSNATLLRSRRAVVMAAPAPPRELSRREAAELWDAVTGYFGSRAFRALPRREWNRFVVDSAEAGDVADLESLMAGGR